MPSRWPSVVADRPPTGIGPLQIDIGIAGHEPTTTNAFAVSGKQQTFSANIFVSSSCQTSVIHATRNAFTYITFAFDNKANAVVELRPRPALETAGFLSGTAETAWGICANTIDDQFGKGLSELRSIVSAIESGIVPQRSAAFEDLLERALRASETPVGDLDQWARRLAKDVSDFND